MAHIVANIVHFCCAQKPASFNTFPETTVHVQPHSPQASLQQQTLGVLPQPRLCLKLLWQLGVTLATSKHTVGACGVGIYGHPSCSIAPLFMELSCDTCPLNAALLASRAKQDLTLQQQDYTCWLLLAVSGSSIIFYPSLLLGLRLAR